jgi:hypothetical protein
LKLKNILLIDIEADGHRPAFAKLFAKYLVKAGYFVVIAFPDKEKSAWIEASLLSDGIGKNNFRMVDHTARRNASSPRLGSFGDVLSTLKLWRDTATVVEEIESVHNIRIDKVFLAWLDSYLANYLSHRVIDTILNRPWSGMYFHPWFLYDPKLNDTSKMSSIDSVFRSKFCSSIAIHDEFVSDKLSLRTGKRVVIFPEAADSTPPAKDFPMADEIKKKSNGRMAIGLIGLARRKGIMLLLNLAMKAEPSDFFFVMIGPIIWHEYSEAEKVFISDFLDRKHENVFYHPEYLDEGANVNAVICALDVLYLVYENFKSSSNFVTKAAIFRKPVLAADQHWMGKVVRKYGMGEVVAENNLDQALAALKLLKRDLGHFNFEKYSDYMRIHAEENLEQVFRRIF